MMSYNRCLGSLKGCQSLSKTDFNFKYVDYLQTTKHTQLSWLCLSKFLGFTLRLLCSHAFSIVLNFCPQLYKEFPLTLVLITLSFTTTTALIYKNVLTFQKILVYI